MRMYIDEAGGFVAQADGQPLFSLVLAVVIPSSMERMVFDAVVPWDSGTHARG
jgi:hypothetical protein